MDAEREAASEQIAIRLDAKERANGAAQAAIERMILATKAVSLADAAVHTLHLRHLADDVEAAVRDGNDESAQRALFLIERLARSIFDVLIRETGADPAELAADYFLASADRLWPRLAAQNLFAAAVAAFEDQARDTLSVPAEPTGAMIDAAVQATGCAPAQVRQGFAAMVRAYQQERAA
ncbi:hypothetical protein D3869_26630 (plasmid) [Azospirillum brasilense]|uniref:Uncharacterized protein n=2 Tax=Azospirillum brasilense TaxID=192 RepID=A0A4D8RHD7_AZOBR|nr:hypothetical protein D3869_26630 [Azospirillum brasilense]